MNSIYLGSHSCIENYLLKMIMMIKDPHVNYLTVDLAMKRGMKRILRELMQENNSLRFIYMHPGRYSYSHHCRISVMVIRDTCWRNSYTADVWWGFVDEVPLQNEFSLKH